MPHPVIHFELLGPGDPAALQRFYAETFGWKITADPMPEYGLVEADGGIGGGVGSSQDGQPHSIVYIAVDDPAEYLEKVVAAGGRKVQDAQVVPGMVTYAQFADPAGNIVGLVANETPPAE